MMMAWYFATAPENTPVSFTGRRLLLVEDNMMKTLASVLQKADDQKKQ